MSPVRLVLFFLFFFDGILAEGHIVGIGPGPSRAFENASKCFKCYNLTLLTIDE